MATSSVSSLGLGSNGVLTYDTIDKLRAVDDNAQITPIDNKLSENSTKKSDLSIITTLTASLKSMTSSLSDELSYLKRNGSVTGDAVTASVSSGTAIQSFTLDVTTVAKKDVYQSDTFAATTSTFTATNDTIRITVNGVNYDIDVDATTTLSEFKDAVYDATNGKVTASILNVGGTEPYRLILKSTSEGESNAITLSSAGTGTAVTDLGLDIVDNHIQTASNAVFTYDGVEVVRSSNTITDLIVGVSLSIKEVGSSTVSIANDTSDLVSDLESFVSKYNELISNLNEATKYDSDLETAGTFQGVSQITSLTSAINRQLLSVDEEGRALTNYGLTLNDGGVLEFDSTVFNEKISTDSADVEDFFRGSTTVYATNIYSSTVSAGAIDVVADDFKINGTSVIFSTNGTASENALALRNAINSASISGISASLNSDGTSVKISSEGGDDVAITGNSTLLSSLGLESKSILGKSSTRYGVFYNFNTTLASYIDETNGILTLFETQLANESSALTTERARSVARLDAKYDILANQFMAYDALISKLNSQFSSLSLMISQSVSTSN
ncbi:MAG: flagellar filament capping protein FliD [Sulfurospirillaceae bacterium]|nr:flagellar filament capping protein FliD [Sulfurospirillaceae bacterium]